MRIDIHVHGSLNELSMPADDYVAHCRKGGIEKIGLIDYCDALFKAHEKFPDFVIPIARFDMDVVTPTQLHDAIDRGALGIKFMNPRFPYGDPRYDNLYKAISDRKCVMVFHTGYLGASKIAEASPYTDMSLMRPAEVDRVSRRYPDLKIVMAHYGNPWWEEAWKITWSNPNVYADLSGGTAYKRSLLMWREILAPNGDRDDNSLSKLLFATDYLYAFADEYIESCQPYCDFYDKIMEAVNATSEQIEQINRGTSARLFRLD